MRNVSQLSAPVKHVNRTATTKDQQALHQTMKSAGRSKTGMSLCIRGVPLLRRRKTFGCFRSLRMLSLSRLATSLTQPYFTTSYNDSISKSRLSNAFSSNAAFRNFNLSRRFTTLF
jgi:hypothetical protein